jgi:hypothetical protein
VRYLKHLPFYALTSMLRGKYNAGSHPQRNSDTKSMWNQSRLQLLLAPVQAVAIRKVSLSSE